MGENTGDFEVDTSDQTTNVPTTEPKPADAPQLDDVSDLETDAQTNDSKAGDNDDSKSNSGDSSDSTVGVSDDTAHAGYQPPSEPAQPTIGPDDRRDKDESPEEQHDEERDDTRRKIEEDSSREADPEP